MTPKQEAIRNYLRKIGRKGGKRRTPAQQAVTAKGLAAIHKANAQAKVT